MSEKGKTDRTVSQHRTVRGKLRDRSSRESSRESPLDGD